MLKGVAKVHEPEEAVIENILVQDEDGVVLFEKVAHMVGNIAQQGNLIWVNVNKIQLHLPRNFKPLEDIAGPFDERRDFKLVSNDNQMLKLISAWNNPRHRRARVLNNLKIELDQMKLKLVAKDENAIHGLQELSVNKTNHKSIMDHPSLVSQVMEIIELVENQEVMLERASGILCNLALRASAREKLQAASLGSTVIARLYGNNKLTLSTPPEGQLRLLRLYRYLVADTTTLLNEPSEIDIVKFLCLTMCATKSVQVYDQILSILVRALVQSPNVFFGSYQDQGGEPAKILQYVISVVQEELNAYHRLSLGQKPMLSRSSSDARFSSGSRLATAVLLGNLALHSQESRKALLHLERSTVEGVVVDILRWAIYSNEDGHAKIEEFSSFSQSGLSEEIGIIEEEKEPAARKCEIFDIVESMLMPAESISSSSSSKKSSGRLKSKQNMSKQKSSRGNCRMRVMKALDVEEHMEFDHQQWNMQRSQAHEETLLYSMCALWGVAAAYNTDKELSNYYSNQRYIGGQMEINQCLVSGVDKENFCKMVETSSFDPDAADRILSGLLSSAICYQEDRALAIGAFSALNAIAHSSSCAARAKILRVYEFCVSNADIELDRQTQIGFNCMNTLVHVLQGTTTELVHGKSTVFITGCSDPIKDIYGLSALCGLLQTCSILDLSPFVAMPALDITNLLEKCAGNQTLRARIASGAILLCTKNIIEEAWTTAQCNQLCDVIANHNDSGQTLGLLAMSVWHLVKNRKSFCLESNYLDVLSKKITAEISVVLMYRDAKSESSTSRMHQILQGEMLELGIYSGPLESTFDDILDTLNALIGSLWQLISHDADIELVKKHQKPMIQSLTHALPHLFQLTHLEFSSKHTTSLEKALGQSLMVLWTLLHNDVATSLFCQSTLLQALLDIVYDPNTCPNNRSIVASIFLLARRTPLFEAVATILGRSFMEEILLTFLADEDQEIQGVGASLLSQLPSTDIGQAMMRDEGGILNILSLLRKDINSSTKLAALKALRYVSLDEISQEYLCRKGLKELLCLCQRTTDKDQLQVIAQTCSQLSGNTRNRSLFYKAELAVRQPKKHKKPQPKNETASTKTRLRKDGVKDEFETWLDVLGNTIEEKNCYQAIIPKKSGSAVIDTSSDESDEEPPPVLKQTLSSFLLNFMNEQSCESSIESEENPPIQKPTMHIKIPARPASISSPKSPRSGRLQSPSGSSEGNFSARMRSPTRSIWERNDAVSNRGSERWNPDIESIDIRTVDQLHGEKGGEEVTVRMQSTRPCASYVFKSKNGKLLPATATKQSKNHDSSERRQDIKLYGFAHVPGARVYDTIPVYETGASKLHLYHQGGPLYGRDALEHLSPPPSVPQFLLDLPLTVAVSVAKNLDIFNRRVIPAGVVGEICTESETSVKSESGIQWTIDGQVADEPLPILTTIQSSASVMMVEEPPEPKWALDNSIFAMRIASMFNDKGVRNLAFENDWLLCEQKRTFRALLTRSGTVEDLKVNMRQQYAMVCDLFRYYSAHDPMNHENVFQIEKAEYSDFCTDVGVRLPEGICMTVFIQVVKNPLDELTVEQQAFELETSVFSLSHTVGLMRFQFLECLIRLAEHKYIHTNQADCLSKAVKLLFTEMQELPTVKCVVSSFDTFRGDIMYTQQVDEVLRGKLSFLKQIFKRFAGNARNSKRFGGLRGTRMTKQEWESMLVAGGVFNPYFTMRSSNIAFRSASLDQEDEIKDWTRVAGLCFTDFLEAVVRSSSCLVIPTRNQMEEVGVETHIEFYRLMECTGLWTTVLKQEHSSKETTRLRLIIEMLEDSNDRNTRLDVEKQLWVNQNKVSKQHILATFKSDKMQSSSTLSTENRSALQLAVEATRQGIPVDRFEVHVASTLHDVWRENRGRIDEIRFSPRIKTIDDQEFDIANLGFRQLPGHFQMDNLLAAYDACESIRQEYVRVVKHGGHTTELFDVLSSEEFLSQAAHSQHDNWLKRNKNKEWVSEEQNVSFERLGDSDKKNNISIIETAVSVWKANHLNQ